MLRQFFTEAKEESADDERELADNLEEVLVNITSVPSTDDGREAEENASFMYMSTAEDTTSPASFVASLQDIKVMHTLSGTIPPRYGDTFKGVMIDTGAARGSTSGKRQYFAYCRSTGREPKIDSRRAAVCHFGIGSAKSCGVANIAIPVGNLWVAFNTHIVDADVPTLLCIDDMDRLGLFYNNLTNKLIHPASGAHSDVVRVQGHPFIQWNERIETHFTHAELQRLHRRFGHPHVDKLYNLLKRSEVSNVNAATRKTLQQIEKSCGPCQEYAQRPRRFKFTLRDDVDFNHTVYADIFYIDGQPILHVVDEATRFQAARWLSRVTSESIWQALRRCWIDVYLGPPDVIAHDAGKNFMGRAFQANADMMHIKTKSIPVEAAHSMSIVERYHKPIRRAFNVIKKEAADLDKEDALQMAVKAINDSTGPDGIVPTLLVFGALPRLGLPNDQPSPSTFKRAAALRKATEAMSREFAKRQVREAMASRNGPNVTAIHDTPVGSPVLVYRPEKDK